MSVDGLYGRNYDEPPDYQIDPDGKPPVSSWAPVDLTLVLSGVQVEPDPTLLLRIDGMALLYAGKLHTIAGETESGKTWLALLCVAQCVLAGLYVLYLDFEDSAATIVTRLQALGVTNDLILEHLRYVRPDEPLSTPGAKAVIAADVQRATLVVFDGVTEAMGMHNYDMGDNMAVAKFNRHVVKPFAHHGAAVVSIDHVPKSGDRGPRFAIGAQHKLAGIDGAAYVTEVKDNFGRGMTGRTLVRVAKDRPGNVRGQSDPKTGAIGILVMESSPDGRKVRARLDPPTPGDVKWRPTVLMGRVSGYLQGISPKSETKTEIATAVTGKKQHVLMAVDELALDGFIAPVDRLPLGDGASATAYRFVKLFDPANAAAR